jgi:alpha-L-fucosidase
MQIESYYLIRGWPSILNNVIDLMRKEFKDNRLSLHWRSVQVRITKHELNFWIGYNKLAEVNSKKG